MASVGEPMSRSSFVSHTSHYSSPLPIMSVSSPSPRFSHTQPMDISEPSAGNTSSAGGSPKGERGNDNTAASQGEQQQQSQQSQQSSSNGATNPPAGAATAAHPPKVVQTAFIHKLYNMLEDQSIQHLISWSSSNESFVMSPSSEFSKVLAQYFKHTNVSSFVRQLNMYGFHKVSDVFHTAAPDSPLWEFKHGQGSFKRGNVAALREIKRRASRHALITRESFPTPPKMPAPAQPGARLEPMQQQPAQEPADARSQMLDWGMNDLYTRLSRTEEAYSAMTNKCQALLEGLTKCHQWDQDLAGHLLTLIPDADNPIRREISAMREDIVRHTNQLRALEDPQESLFTNKQPFAQHSIAPLEPSLPMSPRQRPFDESRRPSLQGLAKPGGSLRGAMPNHLSPRRYGSIGTGNGMHSPSSRPSFLPPPPPIPQQPPMQHPLSISSSPPNNLARRHTSADIRVEGWQGGAPPPLPSATNPAGSPYASGQNSSAYPSSPRAPGHPHEHQQLRDALAQYELPRPLMPSNNNTNQHSAHNLNGSRHSSPPPPGGGGGVAGGPHDQSTSSATTNNPPSSNTTNTTASFSTPHHQQHQQQHLSYANPNDAGWQLPGPRYPFKAGLETPPQGSATRRSSMASNVHSLLNPADTAEREGEDEGSGQGAAAGLGIGGAGGGGGSGGSGRGEFGGFEERKRKRVQ